MLAEVNQVADIAARIADASQSQSHDIAQLSDEVGELDGATQQNAAVAEAMAMLSRRSNRRLFFEAVYIEFSESHQHARTGEQRLGSRTCCLAMSPLGECQIVPQSTGSFWDAAPPGNFCQR